MWLGAPAYAEGTPNTSGGIPAILHDNEAVVPLSRGRSIPIEMNGNGGQQAPAVTHYHMTNNIQAKDVDSFRKTSGQLANETQQMIARLHARNG